MQNGSTNEKKEYSYQQKVWMAAGIGAFVIVMLLLLRATFSVLLLVLAGVLIAVFFRALSDFIHRKTGWKEGICLTASVLGTLLLLVLLFWLVGARVQSQIIQLAETFPATVEKAKATLKQNPLGQRLLDNLSSPETQQKTKAVAQTVFRSTFGILGDIYVILFLSIFFTISPQVYKKGMVLLVPKASQPKANAVLTKIADNLKKWLKGKLFAMLVVFILTAIGLVIIGVPMWIALALIAGILNFIPNFGPLIAMIPAVLVGLLQSPATAATVAGLYLAVQITESNFITPMVQKKLIKVPPALIILAQLFIAPLTGAWGLVLATPLMVIILILVQELYIKQQSK